SKVMGALVASLPAAWVLLGGLPVAVPLCVIPGFVSCAVTVPPWGAFPDSAANTPVAASASASPVPLRYLLAIIAYSLRFCSKYHAATGRRHSVTSIVPARNRPQ